MEKLIKTKSGLTVLYKKNKQSLGSTLGVYIKAGSRNEDEDSAGIAHFIEHMLFKGTKRRTSYDIANDIESLGAANNAATGKSATYYYIKGLDKFLDNYFDILSDMILFSTFDPKDIAKEKQVVIEELKMYEDDPNSVNMNMLDEKLFPRNKYGKPIIGTLESIKAFDQEKIKRFMDKYYRPENMSVAYVGPTEEKDLLEYVDKYFNKEYAKRRYPNKFEPYKYNKFNQKTCYATKTDRQFSQSSIIISFPAKPYSNKYKAVIGYMATMLGDGSSSRLFQNVREKKGLVYDIYSTSQLSKGVGTYTIEFACVAKKAALATSVVRKTLCEILEKGFTEEEFNRAKLMLETAFAFSNESAFSQMRFIASKWLLTDKLITLKKYNDLMNEVTLDEVNNLFKEVIDFDKVSVGYVGNPIEENIRDILVGKQDVYDEDENN